MFPYFLTNHAFRIVKRQDRVLPRMVMDGVFACPLQRIGCPDFDHAGVDVNRTVMISVFPTELLSFTTTPKHDQIGPVLEDNYGYQAIRLARMAMYASNPKELLV